MSKQTQWVLRGERLDIRAAGWTPQQRAAMAALHAANPHRYRPSLLEQLAPGVALLAFAAIGWLALVVVW